MFGRKIAEEICVAGRASPVRHERGVRASFRIPDKWLRPDATRSADHCASGLWGVDHAAEADGSGPIAGRRNEQEFLVLVEAIGLWEIPDGSAGLVEGAAS
jgi:hypothetical protein